MDLIAGAPAATLNHNNDCEQKPHLEEQDRRNLDTTSCHTSPGPHAFLKWQSNKRLLVEITIILGILLLRTETNRGWNNLLQGGGSVLLNQEKTVFLLLSLVTGTVIIG